MIIDIHTHLWRTPEIGRQAAGPGRPYTGIPSEHLATMASSGTDMAVGLLVTATREMRERAVRERKIDDNDTGPGQGGLALDEMLLRRLDRNNTWGCNVGREHPELIPFVHVDPDLLAGHQLANYVKNRVADGAKGVKLLPTQNLFHADDRRLWPMYEYLEDEGLPFLCQSGTGGGMSKKGQYWASPARFEDVARDFPRLNMILAHALAGFLDSWEVALSLAERFPNVHYDTTIAQAAVWENEHSDPGAENPRRGLLRDLTSEKLAGIMQKIGIEHIVFGTNFPLMQYERIRDIETIQGLPLTDSEKEAVLGGNAARILNIGNGDG
jgi:predicted TIM-barrel fold metal-dependent hydrolase